MTQRRSFFGTAANALRRFSQTVAARKQARQISDLPDYLLKDIGWPAELVDCTTDRVR